MKRILLILFSLVILNDTISQKCLAFIYPVDSQQICTNKLITLRATGHNFNSQNKNQTGAQTDKEPTNTVSYLWSTGETSAIINIQKRGTYTVTIFNSITGCKSIASFTNHSNTTTNTITGDSTVCRGNTLQFSTTGTGGTWKSSNISAVGTIDQNGLFTTGTSAGTTKIMYIVKNTNGCSDTASKWITILQRPTAGTIAGAASVCMSGTIQFSTTGTGGTWSSSNISDVGTINQNGLFSTGTRAGTTKIMYIVTNANGCSDTASKWITIYYRPNAGTITGDSTVCRGNTLQFSTTGTGGTWKSSNISAVGTIDQNGLFTTGTSAGTTKIMYIVKNTNGCSDTASKWITIRQKPTAGTIAGAASVCMSGTIPLTTTGTGGTWSSSNISDVGTINQNGLFSTGTRAGTTKIMYIVTNANGCSDTASKWITIYYRPNAGTITGDSTVCRGNTIQFSTTGTGGTWKSSNISAVGTIDQNGLFTTGTSAGTTKIMYIVKNTNGCSDTASKWITILQKPTAGTIAGAASVCMSGTIQLTTTGTGGTWSSSNISDVGTINQNGLFTTGTRAGTTKIMYIVTNANGCSDTTSKWITIYYRPNAGTITGDSTVCRGNSLQFSTTGTGGTWKSSNISAVGTIDQNGLFTTGTSAGTTKIMYIVKNTNGCSDTASKWITILQKPTAGAIAGAASVCMSGTIQLTTTGTGGTWSSSNISDVGTINQNGLFTTGTRAGTNKIMYIVTNANGCSDTASKWINIYYRPNAGTITGDSTVCRGNSLQFSTTGTGGTWKSSNISAVGTIDQNGLFTTGTSAGTTKIMYIVKNTNGCSDTASKWITILQKPTAGTIAGAASVCMSGTIQLTASVHGGAWSSSDTSIASVGSNGLVTGKSPGNVEIRYTVISSTNNCTNTISKMITVTPQSFAKESQGNQIANRSITNSEVLLAPNPSNNQFRLVIHSADNKTSIRVFDINGKTFYSTTTTGNQTITFGETLAPGIYIVEIRQGSDVKIIKAVKIK